MARFYQAGRRYLDRSNGLVDRKGTISVEQRPILVVDDDETIAMTIESFLTEEGYTVMVAQNGKEALERAEESPPAVILLDMKMPVMDGWAFASAYRQQEG